MRKRRIFKWVGLVACVLILLTFVLSGWWWNVRLIIENYWCVANRGAIVFGYFGVTRYSGWQFSPKGAERLLWWIELNSLPSKHFWRVVIPLWIPLVITAIPTMVAWRLDRRSPPGHCQKCGYDLTGNVSGACPECGTDATEVAAQEK